MKKILLLLVLVGNITFAQKLTKEQLSEKLAEKACGCAEKQEITKENFELTIGICLLEGISAYEKDVEKHYGKDIISNDLKMEELGYEVGKKMGLRCPVVFKFMLDDLEEDNDADEQFEVSGKVSEIKSEQFITFIIKEDSGKTNQFILLSNFENAFLLTDKVLKVADAVDVTYYEMELFDAKLGQFISYKIVSDIIKK
ncbi:MULTISPECIES: hypothetical protein [unclassified Flavobacterium]|uniref:hypothetical protein n=1 Tax=unclassified Flavobacterium TaxID=196869 RepID=UPI0012912DCB|nr:MULTISPECIES: hypothetical protein [unclassified Flavobacterium]MQP53494.1 hypothetical protein [Flavobacterium sp. LMO9]MQP63403.1 hypothetical protein [Flavobacterium sp. LMO6]